MKKKVNNSDYIIYIFFVVVGLLFSTFYVKTQTDLEIAKLQVRKAEIEIEIRDVTIQSLEQKIYHLNKENSEYRELIQEVNGIASYYSKDGCDGCNEHQIMANGEVFNEDALTIAIGLKPDTTIPLIPLNKNVKVLNEDTGESVIARVTDTGGFYHEKYNWRVADLSKGVAEKVNLKTDKSSIKLVYLGD